MSPRICAGVRSRLGALPERANIPVGQAVSGADARGIVPLRTAAIAIPVLILLLTGGLTIAKVVVTLLVVIVLLVVVQFIAAQARQPVG